jgi:hypothetical protein
MTLAKYPTDEFSDIYKRNQDKIANTWKDHVKRYGNTTFIITEKIKRKIYQYSFGEIYRNAMWNIYYGIQNKKQLYSNVYTTLCQKQLNYPSSVTDEIEKDISRSIRYEYVKSQICQNKLYRILTAFSLYKSEIGYCCRIPIDDIG